MLVPLLCSKTISTRVDFNRRTLVVRGKEVMILFSSFVEASERLREDPTYSWAH
jgi:hypothetical protein